MGGFPVPDPTAPSISQPCSGCSIWFWQPSKALDCPGFGLQLPGQEEAPQEVLSLPSRSEGPSDLVQPLLQGFAVTSMARVPLCHLRAQ